VTWQCKAQSPLIIPDTLVGPNYNLTMHLDSVQFFSNGPKSITLGYNSNHYLGPTLILNKGASVNITVNNQISDTTTVHWHGLHVPSKWDGGPHTPILSGTTWNPQFQVKDNAATYWYHPHLHEKTALQAIKGAAGLIIVRDSIEAQLILPRKYGIDDIPLIVQCQQFDSLNQALPLGMQDSTLLVNGTRTNNGNIAYLDLPAQIVRLRILNASGERVFNFGFSGNKNFYQIASDGGLLNAPFDTTRLRLGPGERAEILISFIGMTGQSISLMSYASEIPMGTQGGPTMPMIGGPPMDSPLNGVDFNVLDINVVSPTANPILTIPTSLVVNTPYLESQSNTARKIDFTAASDTIMDGPFYFNDSTFNMMRIDYIIPLNSIEVWTLVNKTMVAHPFHLHDEQFYILDRNGMPPPPSEQGRKDVVLVAPGDSVRIIAKFTEYTDSLIPYMYHCHILMHEDAGMMGQFIVSSSPVGIADLFEQYQFELYPNPATVELNIKAEPNVEFSIEIFNLLGERVFYSSKRQIKIPTLQFESGLYIVKITSNKNTFIKKIIKQFRISKQIYLI
jgi:bilirubin oxidase